MRLWISAGFFHRCNMSWDLSCNRDACKRKFCNEGREQWLFLICRVLFVTWIFVVFVIPTAAEIFVIHISALDYAILHTDKNENVPIHLPSLCVLNGGKGIRRSVGRRVLVTWCSLCAQLWSRVCPSATVCIIGFWALIIAFQDLSALSVAAMIFWLFTDFVHCSNR